ncbi:MAG: FAD-dependent oxidoreductase [Anaerolineaceae bacterium]|nr:FAD-dependent oxidoreductase [Anaerolineaceae bacterium]
MHIGIIGGGLMGVTLAYYLAQAGEQVTILEQGASLGGLNGELSFDDGLEVARYQHAILPNDQAVRALCSELHIEKELIMKDAYSGFVHHGKVYALSNISDFLSFPPLSMLDRVRLGRTIMQARRRDWYGLDQIPVQKWLENAGGKTVFSLIWQPLLEAKFDGEYAHIPATYIWAWINRMTSIRRLPQLKGQIGYLRRGHFSLIQALADAFVKQGGTIKYQVRVREIDISGGQLQQVRTPTGAMQFDAVVAAVATPVFAHMIPGADTNYLNQLSQSRYLGLICPVVVLNRPLTTYWTLNLTDPTSPFSTIIETVHPEHDGNYIVYLPKYTSPDNDWMGVPDETIREAWLTHLAQLFPDFREEQIQHFAVSRSRYVEPVYTTHASTRTLGIQTPYRGLFLANTAQVYPELPTSEAAVVHAQAVAQQVRESLGSR